MIQEKFFVDQNIIDNLQKFTIEIEARQSLIAFMIDKDMVHNANFEKYQQEYIYFYTQYLNEKSNFEKKYVHPILIEKNLDPEKSRWSIDFDNKECTIVTSE